MDVLSSGLNFIYIFIFGSVTFIPSQQWKPEVFWPLDHQGVP